MLIVWPYMPSHWSAQHLGLDNALKEFAPGCMPHPASAPQRRVHALPTILKQGALAWNSRALPWAWTQWSNRCSGCPGARATAWKQNWLRYCLLGDNGVHGAWCECRLLLLEMGDWDLHLHGCPLLPWRRFWGRQMMPQMMPRDLAAPTVLAMPAVRRLRCS